MYGVVRFLDTDLLPASSPEDYPKIIKSGIDEEGQNRKSPSITGPSGIATLLHKIGRHQLLERLFDTTGTEEYDLRVFADQYLLDIYVKRRGLDVEIGFINSSGEWAQHGVRYRIVPEPAGSPYRVGKWIPVSTSDLDSDWGGSEEWVRAQGAAVAKAVWYHKHFNQPKIEISWSGMTESDKEDLAIWLRERAERLAESERIANEEHQKRKATLSGVMIEERMMMQAYYASRMACRADCGEKNPKLCCSKCKTARYCSSSCQLEDWKYHKTYCGTEIPITQADLDPFLKPPVD